MVRSGCVWITSSGVTIPRGTSALPSGPPSTTSAPTSRGSRATSGTSSTAQPAVGSLTRAAASESRLETMTSLVSTVACGRRVRTTSCGIRPRSSRHRTQRSNGRRRGRLRAGSGNSGSSLCSLRPCRPMSRGQVGTARLGTNGIVAGEERRRWCFGLKSGRHGRERSEKSDRLYSFCFLRALGVCDCLCLQLPMKARQG